MYSSHERKRLLLEAEVCILKLLLTNIPVTEKCP